MSTFAVGLTTCTFTVNQTGFEEQYTTLLRQWDFEVLLALSTDYATLTSLYSYPVSIRTCPGSAGATMTADIGGGAGAGVLTVDNMVDSPFDAALVHVGRPSMYPGGGCRVRVTFQEVPPP